MLIVQIVVSEIILGISDRKVFNTKKCNISGKPGGIEIKGCYDFIAELQDSGSCHFYH